MLALPLIVAAILSVAACQGGEANLVTTEDFLAHEQSITDRLNAASSPAEVQEIARDEIAWLDHHQTPAC